MHVASQSTSAGLGMQIAWLSSIGVHLPKWYLSQGNDTEQMSYAALTVDKKGTPTRTFSCMSLTE
jgi:hypothetical protein